MTSSQKIRLENQLTGYANEEIKIDDSSATGVVYAFVSELSMFRIAEKMRSMPNFRYGYSKNLNTHYVSLELS